MKEGTDMRIKRKAVNSAIGTDINTSDNPYAQNVRYLEEFAEGVVGTLSDDYDLTARYEMTSQGITFKIYDPERKGKYRTVSYYWEDMELNDQDMEDDINYAVSDIISQTVGVYAATSTRRSDFWSVEDAAEQTVQAMQENLAQGIKDFELEINESVDTSKFWNTLNRKASQAGVAFTTKETDKQFDDHYYYMYISSTEPNPRGSY